MAQKTIPKKVKRLVDQFIYKLQKDKLPIEQVFIFGSFAKGKQHRWSDIDVCIVSPQFSSSWDAITYLWQRVPKTTSPTEPSIEPIGFHPKDFCHTSSLISEIKQHGIRIR